ncbi:universal stress protein UspA [Cytophagales bacterium WSM2-2]|nr:universal stress protein UspA [Cytophagales bacterium WSM2-2]
MKNILVPCDFSKPAIGAYQQALVVAAQSQGVIHLLHVIEPPVMNDTLLMPTLNFEQEMMKEMKDKATEDFKRITKESKTEHVKVSYDIQYGAVSTVIRDYIKENQIDFVIMGSTGASGFKEYFIGSNAERVVRNSPVPVLVVKEFSGLPIKNIVFPNTLDVDHQEALATKVKVLQEFFKAKLHIVYINTPSNFIVDTVIRPQLDEFAQRFMFKNYTVNIFSHLTTEGGIVEFTKMINGNLIALGTHGRKGLNHLFKGSIAEDLVNHTQCLVWTCRLNDELVEA